MKRAFLGIFALAITAFSCGKDDNSDSTPPPAEKFMSFTAGNQWTYQLTDNKPATPVVSEYTLTATANDTTVIGGRIYKIFTSSSGPNQYYNNTGSEYYQYVGLPADIGDVKIENLYLKDNVAVGVSWNIPVNITYSSINIPVTLTNRVEEKGLTRIVNSITYTDVIKVSSTLSSSMIPASSLNTDIVSYYAPKYGLIESKYVASLNYLGISESVNTETKLKSKNF